MNVTPELRIAVAAEYKKIAAAAESREKATFVAANPIGIKTPLRDHNNELIGSVQIPESTTRKPSPRIEDESVVMAWAVEQFGPDVVEEIPATVRLTEQGKKSVLAAAESGDEVPGVVMVEPAPSAPYAKWVPKAGAAEKLVDLVAREGLDVAAVLKLPAGGAQ